MKHTGNWQEKRVSNDIGWMNVCMSGRGWVVIVTPCYFCLLPIIPWPYGITFMPFFYIQISDGWLARYR